MKRGGFLRRNTPLAAKSQSETALIKDRIQDVARLIVIERDGGCILRHLQYRDFPACGGYAKDGHLILQADHLVTRANSATFADTRLIVTLCKAHHGWKSLGSNARKAQYDELVKGILPADRVELWERAERDSWRPHRNYTSDWKAELAYLESLLKV